MTPHEAAIIRSKETAKREQHVRGKTVNPIIDIVIDNTFTGYPPRKLYMA